MSEYWVSQAKYYCKVCNCYIADNKPSRQHHDNGAKHKEKVELLMKQKRQEKLHGARSESELKQQLADIEKAAKEAIAVDRTEQDGFFYQNSGVRPRMPPPPPAPRPPGFPQPKAGGGDAEDDAEQLEDDDGTGMYTVKGQTYLQGKVHEDKIRSGMPCEVFVEALDEWFPGSITARHETPIPHTALFLLTFDVEYAVTGQAAAEDTVVRDTGVKSDRIRLLAAADGTLPGYEAPAGSGIVAPKPIVLNENTGLGMWQTVAVREVDEEALLAEQLQSELAREAMLRGKSSNDHDREHGTGAGGKAGKQQGNTDADNYYDDSAMSAYDPYGRHSHIYKGVHLTEDTDHKEFIESIAQGASVSFKKRKTAPATVNSAAPIASNSAAAATTTTATIVKAESKEEYTAASASVGSDSAAIVPNPANLSNISAESAAVETKPVVVSMKIGNMQGGAKRKFRVREPSPP